MSVPTLQELCIRRLMVTLEETNFHPQAINELCKLLSNCQHLLDPILEYLLSHRAVTDVALIAFLVPDRLVLDIAKVANVRNSTLKMIGFNCPNLVHLNLSDCIQVSNAVVRSILHGCPRLREVHLNRCVRVTDSAFDAAMSPFDIMQGCFSLENISLQGCNQITGNLATLLIKQCRRLRYLNLSQCKHIAAPAIQDIFNHNQLRSLNLAFTDVISDESFLVLPSVTAHPLQYPTGGGLPDTFSNSPASLFLGRERSALERISLGMSSITDKSLYRLACFGSTLKEICLQWCDAITDDGIRVLVRHCLQLSDMNLKSCRGITDSSLQAIGRECPALRHLNISWCHDISDDGILQLTPDRYGKCTQLKSLCVVWCPQVTDTSICALSALPSLQTVQATGCEGITERSINTLRSRGIQVSL
mmetsp:Transcript_8517/g.12715  ORF Transcript_8517/g.12715 Transcript_8517/m.12715 type:complete len:419 (-) Transcript_8517:187-1443(-)